MCDLLTNHASQISGLNVDAIIRGGIRKFSDDVGRLWTSLADYYIRRKLLEKARDVFEEGMTTVVTVRDFSVIFDAYSQFEESVLALKMEAMSEDEQEEEECECGKENGVDQDDGEEEEEDYRLNVGKLKEKKLKKFWLCEYKDVDLRIARLEHLLDRRPELANSVLLRQNPHNVEQWHRRVKIFEGHPTKQILTYTEAVRTIDPMKAVGKPHTLWVAFAKLYETHNDVANARVILDKAVQVDYKAVDNLASVWCEWAEMELRHKNFKGALELMRRATAEPSAEVKRRGKLFLYLYLILSCMFDTFVFALITLTISYGHTMLKAPDPVRSPQLSNIWTSQYYGGGPHGNIGCCSFCNFFCQNFQ